MKPLFYRVVPACFTLVCGNSSALAAVIASDNFNSYTAGALTGGTGGTGWSAGWTAPTPSAGTSPVTTTTATVADVSGNKKVTSAATHGSTANPPQSASTVVAARGFTTALTSTFYISYKVAYTGSSPDAFNNNNTFGLIVSNLAVSDTTAPTATVASNVFNFGMRIGNGSSGTQPFIVRAGTSATPVDAQTTSPNPVVANTEYLLVAKLTRDTVGGDFDRMDLWVNPTSSTEVTSDAFHSLGVTSGVTQITSLMFRQAANQTADTYQFDDLVVGSTWADVVPEPGTAGLLGLSLCGLLGLRTRGKR